MTASAAEKRASIFVSRTSIDGGARPEPRDRTESMTRALQSKRPSLLIGAKTLQDVYGEDEQEGPRFVRFVINVYRKWGYIIAKNAWLAIFIVLFISSLGIINIFFTPQQNDITGYTPYGARANREFQVYSNFYASHGQPIATYIFGIAKDNGSMIRTEHMEEFLKVISYASSNITLRDDATGKDLSFYEFCHSFCLANEPIRQFAGGMKVFEQGLSTQRIKLNYPTSTVLGTSFSLQPNFFGIEFYGDDDKKDESADDTQKLLGGDSTNATVDRRQITNVKGVKMIAALLRAEQREGWGDQKVKEFEMKVVNHFQNNYDSDLIHVFPFSQTFVEEEMVRGGKIMLPFLVIGFIIMCCVSSFTVMLRAFYMHQENYFKIVLAITACITPILATATALSLMFLFGLRFSSILCVVPFLVLSIGVDSSYLMIHEWQRVTKHAHENPIKGDTVGRRMSEVLSEVGPAILISCLTNLFADLVGSFTSSPEITLLCGGNMLSMCVAFVYQMTFYAGLMCIVGEKEIERDDVAVSASVVDNKTKNIHVQIHQKVARNHSLARTPSKFQMHTQPIVSSFMHKYVKIMANTVVSMTVVVIYIIYLALAIWGITRININLSTKKLFAGDSPLNDLEDLRVKYVLPHFSMVTVVVNEPGNFTHPERLRQMNTMVREFESLDGSWGPDGTKYFARDFQTFLSSWEDDYVNLEDEEAPVVLDPTRYNEEDLRYFLRWSEYVFWGGFVNTKNITRDKKEIEILDKFVFTAGYHGKQLGQWIPRGKKLREWRAVVDKYPQFKAEVYHEDGQYLDLIDNMATDTWQAILGALTCMGLVCFLFLNNWFTVGIASLSVLSICCGILGIMSWLGVDLDPITMAAMIISIGFSVDIPAHVSYHYYTATARGGSSSPEDRLTQCLSSVAFPAVQAATSTILCICSLLFIDLYMAHVSCQIMIICVVLCNIHGLIFIPAILICMDKLRWAFTPRGSQKRPRISPRQRSNRAVRGTLAPENSDVPDRPAV
ncbi:ptr-23 [Pristionchus pacificus]|uniref:Ptr-23 n=1 Tax=Pristionchus pacificus TaxID=54126 RepID=A0A2A6BLK5_PRIPA|nr:ptr-23 [Pristionchus pacificus]|eukprot:PDM66696.1 ptr-23 [Pristionchus pacificus]